MAFRFPGRRGVAVGVAIARHADLQAFLAFGPVPHCLERQRTFDLPAVRIRNCQRQAAIGEFLRNEVQPGPRRGCRNDGRRALVRRVAEQVARSGAVPLTVLLDPPRFGRGGRRLLAAAEAGGAAIVVVSEQRDSSLPAALSLEIRRNTDSCITELTITMRPKPRSIIAGRKARVTE